MGTFVRGLHRLAAGKPKPIALWRPAALVRYGTAVILVVLAFAVTLWSRSVFHHGPFIFYYIPILLSAWLGGFWPGLLGTLLSAIAAVYTFTAGPPVFTPDEAMQIALFLAVGTVTATLSESLRRSEKRLRRKWRQAVAVAETGRRALVEDDLQKFLDYSTRLVAHTLRVEYCKVLQLTPEHDNFLLVAGVGWKPGTVGKAIVEAGLQSQAGYTLASGAPVVVEDDRTDTRFATSSLLSDHKVVSSLLVPIAGKEGPFGVLGVHATAAHAFTADDIAFIQSMANLLAVSILRQRGIQRLAESEARFRTLAELIPQMVWTTTADGSVDYISESWCRFTGLSMQESLGFVGWKRVLHPEDASRVLGRWNESIAKGMPYEVECRLRAANGTYAWILARGIPMRDGDGAIRKWFGTCTDIQNQRLSEEELRNAEKLAVTARMASALAHEINNPLAAVTNLLYLLHGQTEHDDPVLKGYVQAAEQELARVTHISNQMLGLYREPSRPAVIQVSEVLDQVLDLYATKIKEKRATIVKQYFCDEELVGKRGELRHLFSNLLINALEAVRDGGVIQVRTRTGCDPHMPEMKGVQVIIADNGRGIARKDRARIFEPFFTTKTEGGAGLGLWVAESIVRGYNGTIRLRSKPAQSGSGGGTVISVFLPHATASDIVQPEMLARSPALHC